MTTGSSAGRPSLRMKASVSRPAVPLPMAMASIACAATRPLQRPRLRHRCRPWSGRSRRRGAAGPARRGRPSCSRCGSRGRSPAPVSGRAAARAAAGAGFGEDVDGGGVGPALGLGRASPSPSSAPAGACSRRGRRAAPGRHSDRYRATNRASRLRQRIALGRLDARQRGRPRPRRGGWPARGATGPGDRLATSRSSRGTWRPSPPCRAHLRAEHAPRPEQAAQARAGLGVVVDPLGDDVAGALQRRVDVGHLQLVGKGCGGRRNVLGRLDRRVEARVLATEDEVGERLETSLAGDRSRGCDALGRNGR